MAGIRIDETDDIRTTQGGPVELYQQEASKARANLNGTGTIALRDSLNISNVVDNGVGDYSFNFSASFSSSSHSPKSDVESTSTARNAFSCWRNGGITASSCRLLTGNPATQGATDMPTVSIAVHGDLA